MAVLGTDSAIGDRDALPLPQPLRGRYPRSMHSPLDSPDIAAGAGVRNVPATTAGTYVNPVLNGDFPDPAVIEAPDGYYYAYATQTLRDGKWINVQVARSPDLVHWQHLGDAFP